jgi:hypothetical protein
MAGTSKRYYVVNDNYNQDLDLYYGSGFPSYVIYKQRGNGGDTAMIFFSEKNLPIADVFPDPPGFAYPVGYVGDTVHPSVDGSNKYIVTMTSTIDVDRHPKFYVADTENDLRDMLIRLFPAVPLTGTTYDSYLNLLNELHGPGNGYLTYHNILHPGFPFPSSYSDSTYLNPSLVIDPYFRDCWDRSSNAFYDISYHNGSSTFISPAGVPNVNFSTTGAFTGLNTKPLIGIDYFNTVAPITSTGSTMGIEFWVKNADNTAGVSIPAFIRGWSSGQIACGVTINNGTVYAYSNGSQVQVSISNILNAGIWNHIFVSYEQVGAGVGIRCWVNGADFTLGGSPITGNAIVGTHQETATIGCYTANGTSIDGSMPTFGSTHEIAMVRFYGNDTLSLNSEIEYLYQATYERFFL